MRYIAISDIYMLIGAMNESVFINDATISNVGFERTGDVVVTITPTNDVKIEYKAEKEENCLNFVIPYREKGEADEIFETTLKHVCKELWRDE